MARTHMMSIMALAIVLAFSCSSDGTSEETNQGISSSSNESRGSSSSVAIDETDGGRRIITTVHELKNKTEDSFAYIGVDSYHCGDDGQLIPDVINYSISNSALVWQAWGDTLNFTGMSNNLIGAWARTLDKNSSCKLIEDHGDYWTCKENYDIVKAEFTENTIALTRDYCFTDNINEDLTNFTAGANGWKARFINCDTYEIYKGAETVIMKGTVSSEGFVYGGSYTYKGKTCTGNNPTISEQEKACRDAWNKVQIEGGGSDALWNYYRGFLADIENNNDSFMECYMNNLPEEFWQK